MSSHVPIPLTFTLLDSVGDSAFVLVLVEATSTILNYWQEIKTYYLPFLLEAVGPGSKSRHVRRSSQRGILANLRFVSLFFLLL